ncbi:hypothetical protein Ddye_011999 [Dipteronia dyeriana]|uniref:Uncharacterized protein n=1 Tax=Dipteronia dyeriana TaxID=168575 RepID=A0AAD9X3H7_9ROSI|nr:hypothetical protein Ddye_011999 [Dipteronia dyeriana]
MNFNFRGPSNFSYSSSSSNEVEDQLLIDFEAIDVEQEAILAQHGNIQSAIAQYLNLQNNPVTHGGSIPGHIVINRDQKMVDRHLFYDYFVENPRLFLRIVEKMDARDKYFVQRIDSMGMLGLSALQKITTLFRMLAYGCPTDAIDEYIEIGESTTIENAVMEEFAGANNDIDVLKASYLFSNLAQGPIRFWHKHVLHDIITTCIIMCNMIINDERDVDALIEDHMEAPTSEVEMMLDENTRFQEFLAQHREIKDKDAHIALQNALIDHL